MPAFSKFAISRPTLRWAISLLSLLAMCGFLTAGEDSAEEFKNMAREDVERLQEQGQYGETVELEDSLKLKPNIKGFNQPLYIGGDPGPSARIK